MRSKSLYLLDTNCRDMSAAAVSKTNPEEFTCEYCGLVFKSKGEKEEHIKLEHSEHKLPSGVG
jgi:hypothetical protein